MAHAAVREMVSYVVSYFNHRVYRHGPLETQVFYGIGFAANRGCNGTAARTGHEEIRFHPTMTILFLHGWKSVPGGMKPTYLKDHGHMVINPKLPDDDFDAAVRIAQAEFDRHHPDVVVGSSRGGAVAMNIESGESRLVLLCPAWKKYGTAKTAKPGMVILHSRADDVVPFADSEELVRNSKATLIEVGNDHRLADQEPLERMLRACDSDSASPLI